MKYVHTNLIAKDINLVSTFYQEVFECRSINQKRDLSGDWIEKITGVKDVQITGEHLVLPGYDEDHPTLEIFSYNEMVDVGLCAINQYGFSHIAFEVSDVKKTLEKALDYQATLLGELVEKEYDNGKVGTFVYIRDPEGNIVELQSWKCII